jgi:Sulfotransferase family
VESKGNWTFQHPYRTVGMRLYNGIGRQLRRWGWRHRLSPRGILASASRWAGLSDWGDERFHEPLQILVDSLEDDARLNPLGRLLTKFNLTHFAANRLRVQHAIKSHPEILDQPVRRPVFVVGLPRTGTTLLHNLLCQHTGCRPLLLWEALQPAPNSRVYVGRKDRRQANARRLAGILQRWGAPGLRAVHPLDSTSPEECTFLLFNTFVTPAFFLNGSVRGYIDWLQGRGTELMRWAYEQYRHYLQLLQGRGSVGHWVLKSPVHSFGLEALLELFPDARVIQMHRDMSKVIPSACSLFAFSQGIYSDDVDCGRLGPELARLLRSHLLEPAMKARAQHPTQVFDVHYHSLVADPIGTVREIHQYFGLDMDDAMEQRMRQWLAENPSNKHGVHQYDLGQFGLSRVDVDRLFGDYQKQFAVLSEHVPT